MFVSPTPPGIRPIGFAGETRVPVLHEYSTGHPPLSVLQALGQAHCGENQPAIKKISQKEFEAIRGAESYRGSALDFPVDFNRQAVVLIYPAIYTPTGGTYMKAEKVSYNPQDGLKFALKVTSVMYGTPDLGEPWYLAVVDKKYADKGLSFEVKGA